MSRGFVKEEDQEVIPFVVPRAYLPKGITNYVTRFGLNALLDERKELVNELANLTETSAAELRIATNHINAKIAQLNSRISSAKIVDTKTLNKNEVRFGAIVTLKNVETNSVQKFQIVGVDEADVSKQKVSFLSPISKAILNKKIGERAELKLSGNITIFKIINIAY